MTKTDTLVTVAKKLNFHTQDGNPEKLVVRFILCQRQTTKYVSHGLVRKVWEPGRPELEGRTPGTSLFSYLFVLLRLRKGCSLCFSTVLLLMLSYRQESTDPLNLKRTYRDIFN